MNVIETEVKGCLLFEPQKYTDERGYFVELFNQSRYGVWFDLVPRWQQVNCSKSHKGVVRGLHVAPFAKLVNCVKGRIFDVAVDPRPDSPTYLKWVGYELSEESGMQLYIPAGCGHGFMALEESVVVYLQDSIYDPKAESSIHWQDPIFAISWPCDKGYIVSDKDEVAPKFAS